MTDNRIIFVKAKPRYPSVALHCYDPIKERELLLWGVYEIRDSLPAPLMYPYALALLSNLATKRGYKIFSIAYSGGGAYIDDFELTIQGINAAIKVYCVNNKIDATI